jgi:hypothetical protein
VPHHFLPITHVSLPLPSKLVLVAIKIVERDVSWFYRSPVLYSSICLIDSDLAPSEISLSFPKQIFQFVEKKAVHVEIGERDREREM